MRWSTEVLSSIQKNPDFSVRTIAPRRSVLGRGVIAYFWEQFILPFRVRKGELLFSPSNLGPIFCKHQALVLHDLLPLRSNGDFSKRYELALRIIYKILLKRTRLIFTVSNHVKDQIISEYPTVADKVFVIGCGVKEFQVSSSRTPSKDFSFCLIVGAHIRRKNLDFLLGIWAEVFKMTDCKLISTTRAVHDITLASSNCMVEQTGVWYENILDPDDFELAELYTNAKFVLQPSIGEGFGLPLLEGMSLGTPFVSSDVGAATELSVGSSRVLSLNADAWINYLVQVVNKPKCRSEIELQITEANKYSWNLVALKIVMAVDLQYSAATA